EIDIVAAVQDHLAFRLMHEAIAGTGLDGMEGLSEIKPATLRQHQGLAGGDQMNEGQHIGDDLDDRGAAQRSHMEHFATDSLEYRQMRLEDSFLAADQDGDIAAGSLVNAAGHRRFQALNTFDGS